MKNFLTSLLLLLCPAFIFGQKSLVQAAEKALERSSVEKTVTEETAPLILSVSSSSLKVPQTSQIVQIPSVSPLGKASPEILPQRPLMQRPISATVQTNPQLDVLSIKRFLQKVVLPSADPLFEEKNRLRSSLFDVYLIKLPNYFFGIPFTIREEQIEEADKFYKKFLTDINIYGTFEEPKDPNDLYDLRNASLIKCAEVLWAFTGLSLLGTPQAGDTIVDAALLAPKRYQLLTDYVATHALLLLEDWPALQRFINVRSKSGLGAFVELREYLSTVPDHPIYFPQKLTNEDSWTGQYHYPTFQQQLNYLQKNASRISSPLYSMIGMDFWRIVAFANYMHGEKPAYYPLANEDLMDNTRNATNSNFWIPAQIIKKTDNTFLKCISYKEGITANMACLRKKLHRPIVIPRKDTSTKISENQEEEDFEN